MLRGEIARIIYENDDGSFAVLRIRETGSREYTARGALAGLAAGQEVELEGFWEQHAEFGRQFRAESFRIILPSTPDGIKRYLSSGAIPGIGKKTAGLIVDHFKEKTLDMLDGGASCLEQVPGHRPQESRSRRPGLAGVGCAARQLHLHAGARHFSRLLLAAVQALRRSRAADGAHEPVPPGRRGRRNRLPEGG